MLLIILQLKLSYNEIFMQLLGECLYNTEQQLFKRLKRFCQCPDIAKTADIRKQVNLVHG